ncbi:MAG: ABC transporter permease [Coriobacteriia bacterium]|nr:ABC transporter permease [Coriobacteriia bacterium]
MLARSLCLIRKDLRLYLTDIVPLALMVLMPLGFVAFMAPVYRTMLEGQGYRGVNGVEQILPGMMVMFSLFLLGIVGDQFYREYGWGTWNRLRAAADPPEILIGKLVPALAVLACQVVVVFAAGTLMFGLKIEGSVPGAALILVAFAVCLTGILAAEVAWCTTFSRFNALNILIVTMFSGLGGAFTPVDMMPAWAQAAARWTPGYWAIQGLRGVILDGQGLAHASSSAGILMLFALGFLMMAALRFRTHDNKISDN